MLETGYKNRCNRRNTLNQEKQTVITFLSSCKVQIWWVEVQTDDLSFGGTCHAYLVLVVGVDGSSGGDYLWFV